MALDAATILQRLETALRGAGLTPRDLPPNEVFALLRALGLDVDTEQIDRDMRLAVERIRRSVASGRRPDRALLDQAAGALANRIGTSVRTTGKRLIESYAMTTSVSAAPVSAGPQARWMWLAVMDGRTCPSCEERHGAERTLLQWDTEGRPGSEVLICQDNCRCQLWPVQAAGQDVQVETGLPGGQEQRVDAELAVEEVLLRLDRSGFGAEARVGKGPRPLNRAPFDIEGILRSVFQE